MFTEYSSHSLSQKSVVQEMTEEPQKFKENVMPMVEAISKSENLFKETLIGPSGNGSKKVKSIILYSAIIRNEECPCSEKCGKIKMGYVIDNSMTSKTIGRLSHTTPYIDLHWWIIQDANFPETTPKCVGRQWELSVAEVMKVRRPLNSSFSFGLTIFLDKTVCKGVVSC
jgi:hypothetical protein